MAKQRTLGCAIAIASIAGLVAPAHAEDAAPIPVPGAMAAPSASATLPNADARVHHAPPTRATAHEPLSIAAQIDDPHLAKQVLLVFRVGDGAWREVPFLHAREGWLAEIPGDEVTTPSLAYTIEIVRLDGTRVPAFASRERPFVVDVPEDYDDLREQAWLTRLRGRRSEASIGGDFVWFGNSERTGVVSAQSGAITPQTETVSDHYYRTEASYTFRPLRTVIEFGVRLGIVRGTSPRPDLAETPDVGLNYGAASVTFALADDVALEVEGLTSVTEVEFSGGGGAAIHIGDYYGEKLVVGVESIKTFGSRGWVRLDLAHRDVWRVSPIVEVTDQPHAQRAGLRLLVEGAMRFANGFGLVARLGYQARDFHSGGIGGGLALSYAF